MKRNLILVILLLPAALFLLCPASDAKFDSDVYPVHQTLKAKSYDLGTPNGLRSPKTRHDIFSGQLLRYMNIPDLKTGDLPRPVRLSVMREANTRQVIWQSPSFTGDFCVRLVAASWVSIESPSEEPGKTILRITTNVSKAQVFVDDIDRGYAPVEIDSLNPGPHTVIVSKRDHDAFEETVLLLRGKTLTVRAMLEPISRKGVAEGIGDPLKTQVYHGNTKSLTFHRSGCQYFDCKNCTTIFKSRKEAIQAGYRPCQVCKP